MAFSEFLGLKGVKIDRMEIFSRRMEVYFHDYLRKSGFPEIVNWENEVKIAEYIKNSVVDRVTLRDIPLIFRTRNISLMDNIVRLILSGPGSIINVNFLSRILAIFHGFIKEAEKVLSRYTVTYIFFL